jgi:hypothetical protein
VSRRSVTALPVLVAALLCAVAGPATAQPLRAAYVEEVGVYGELERAAVVAFVGRVLREAGYEPIFAPTDRPGCGGDATCMAERARAAGAALAVRATVLGLAGEISIALVITAVSEPSPWQHQAQGVDLTGSAPALSAAVAAVPIETPRRSRARPIAAWTLTASAVALAAGGTWALVEVRSQRRAFFRDHVNAAGEVVDISMDDARRAERNARRWSIAGAALFGGAGAAGVSAVVLFVGGSDGERPRPVGVGLAGSF